jgi:hypothetical protein
MCGSSVTNAWAEDSNINISAYITEDLDERITIEDDFSSYTDKNLLLRLYPLKWADEAIFELKYDPPYYAIYCLEDILLYPVIYQTEGIDALRAKCAAYPKKELAELYLFKAKEFDAGKPDDHNKGLALRLALTGAYMLSTGEWELDIEKLCTWANIPWDWNYIPTALGLLQTELNK